MTWFPHGYPAGSVPRVRTDTGLYRYLNDDLGFVTSLADRGLAEEATGEEEDEVG